MIIVYAVTTHRCHILYYFNLKQQICVRFRRFSSISHNSNCEMLSTEDDNQDYACQWLTIEILSRHTECVHAWEIAWFSMFSILLFFRLVISVLLSTEDGIHELDVSELLYWIWWISHIRGWQYEIVFRSSGILSKHDMTNPVVLCIQLNISSRPYSWNSLVNSVGMFSSMNQTRLAMSVEPWDIIWKVIIYWRWDLWARCHSVDAICLRWQPWASYVNKLAFLV